MMNPESHTLMTVWLLANLVHCVTSKPIFPSESGRLVILHS